ncbi:DNAase [Vibrio maritimus]|uniref:DNAase n=1 Tax=Vibrio maritimus TaxID=990268 RepID=UPI00406963B5
MIEYLNKCPKAIERLKPAFRACLKDFDTLKREVMAGRVGLYELIGDNYHVTIAGEVVGRSYFLWGVSGKGVVPAMRELKRHVKEAGMTSISADTHFPLVARLCRRLNTKECKSGSVTRMEMGV